MIEINGSLLWQFANFVVLMLVLNIILYRPLRAMLEKRRETIEGGHEKARSLEGQVEEKMARYQQQLQEAKMKAGQERAVLREEAAKEEAKILGAAREKANENVQAVKNQVAAEAKSAGETLKEETRAMAGLIASKVLGREV